MKSFLFFTIFALAATVVLSARIRNCGGLAQIDSKNINITGCVRNKRYCVFKKDQTAEISLPFTPKTEVTSLKAVVHGIVAGVPIPFPVPNAQACGNSIQCPVPSGTRVVYKEGLPVKSSYPSISLSVKWELMDQNNKKQVCLLIPVTLQS